MRVNHNQRYEVSRMGFPGYEYLMAFPGHSVGVTNLSYRM